MDVPLVLDQTEILLDIADLRTEFVTDHGVITPVDGVSLRVPHRGTVALVGETGCGKTATAMSVMRLLPAGTGTVVAGRILLHDPSERNGMDLLSLPEARMRAIRGGSIAMVFQEAAAALNPVLTVGAQIAEALKLHCGTPRRAASGRTLDLLRRVRMSDPQRRIRQYPHQLSGGMCQRVVLAAALAGEPKLLIADEPTTGLDVTTQTRILALLREIQSASGMSILLISHDLGVVANLADYVYVMYAGRIVEYGSIRDVFDNPAHPYTRALFRCTPRIECGPSRLKSIPGEVPDPGDYPPGCRYHPRCGLARRLDHNDGRPVCPVRCDGATVNVLESCVVGASADEAHPPLRELTPGHFAACWEL